VLSDGVSELRFLAVQGVRVLSGVDVPSGSLSSPHCVSVCLPATSGGVSVLCVACCGGFIDFLWTSVLTAGCHVAVCLPACTAIQCIHGEWSVGLLVHTVSCQMLIVGRADLAYRAVSSRFFSHRMPTLLCCIGVWGSLVAVLGGQGGPHHVSVCLALFYLQCGCFADGWGGRSVAEWRRHSCGLRCVSLLHHGTFSVSR